ncbi:hypothetical protein ARMSODRAFT_623859 [Armillaria solidipes]|uniref:Uncharacterized protein n=1 Tax=Armillaria solidipes TaxID=1076256 RepID=A0A2H3BCZ6_9AGAR|nr:hypothetical protein ARMSODRAFT_623859 [Armillaria solidipes]
MAAALPMFAPIFMWPICGNFFLMLQHITIDRLGYCGNDPTKCSSYCRLGFVATEIIDSDGNAVPVMSVCAVCKCPAPPRLISKMYLSCK